ncbi:asparagine synthase (glutamine-hydrolyzing) [Streptomyces sp. NPDC006285]|uniref:asparagine synthase (glutamine-hydrolyzing) n=1 Tax=Streptomyces sp. NPDC006285 TaxID=3364742 RepID=UPI0036C4B872
MCGIAGWVSFHRELKEQQQLIEAMTDTMANRGPDDRGVWIDRHVGLGHRRLAVIDLPGGVQPMHAQTNDGLVVIVYSGETYNYRELRAELRKCGHQFATDSDTEVVLQGYLEWGEGLVDRLNGMYAFAIWDARVSQLVMIRDRMGIKPFYYFETEDGVLFGSEPKAILANPLASRVVGPDGLRELFSLVKAPGAAIWEGMRELPPGHLAVVDSHGLRQRSYWTLESTDHTDDRQTTVDHVRQLLNDIVSRQLVADVPRCTLLSGGLDSSALTALAARALGASGEALRSFAVDFPDQEKNFQPHDVSPTVDRPYAHAMAKHAGCNHRDVMLEAAALSAPEVRRAAVEAEGFPVGLGDRENSLYLLFKAVREHSTVALSGEAADELFGGYPWFHDQRSQGDTFPWLVGSHFDTAALLAEDLSRTLDIPAYVRDQFQMATALAPFKDDEPELERRMRQVSHMHLTRVVPRLLDRKDRLSMAVGLEVRVPFCDHRLVEYVFNIPWALKTYDGREKSILRGAVRDLLPQAVAERVKSGYPGSFDPAYASAIQAQANDLLTEDHPALELCNRALIHNATRAPHDNIDPLQRAALERALDVAAWFDLYAPVIKPT